MSGNKGGVRRFISEKAGWEIPYIHCRAHILSLALTNIYKLFHQSPKREEMLHKVQVILNDPILKIPEAIEIRWLSHYKIVYAIKQSYIAIVTTCEHIHQDGADLASLAGGILLSLREEKSLKQDVVNKSSIIKNPTDILNQLNSSRKDDCFKETLSCLSIFLEQTIKEMNRRFNDTALTLFEGCSIFENYRSFSNSSIKIIEQLCNCFYLNENEKDGVLSDYKSFMFVALQKVETQECPITDLLEANIGYKHLKKLGESICCVPIATATVERSFSAMNRIMTKLRNRMGQDTLQYYMNISIEGDEDPPMEYIEKVIDLYAIKKNRRIRFK
ncbi:Ribonuclease H-like domain,HAT, C-terminal dimerisation domain [Cinara cedri]|uniref:Ribonuclease H-like domain,HAT, C-terminal dimerisation domain n=1 Tax=Cinara cedri TaxID=506608 RepID=A0A5E4MRX1_9HEMI|nr:Ribonuclease H-like domain,HAT, C-terminal dimerisation domain [Cinara cedri]